MSKTLDLNINIGASASKAFSTFSQVNKSATTLGSSINKLNSKTIFIKRATNDTFVAIESDIQKVDDQIDALNQKKVNLKLNIDIDAVNNLKEQKSKLNQEIQSLGGKKDILLQKIELETDDTKLKELKEELKATKKEIKSLSQAKLEVSEELHKVQEANKAVNNEIKETQKEIDELNSKRLTLNDDLKNAQEEAYKANESFKKLGDTIGNINFSRDIMSGLDDISSRADDINKTLGASLASVGKTFKQSLIENFNNALDNLKSKIRGADLPELPTVRLKFDTMEFLENFSEVSDLISGIGESVYELNKSLMNTKTLMKMWHGDSNKTFAMGESLKAIGMDGEEGIEIASGMIEDLHYRIINTRLAIKKLREEKAENKSKKGKDGKTKEDKDIEDILETYKDLVDDLGFKDFDSRFKKLKTDEEKFLAFSKLNEQERLDLILKGALKAKDTEKAFSTAGGFLGENAIKMLEYYKMQGLTLDQLAEKRKKLNFFDSIGESGLSSFSSSFGELFTIFKTLTSQVSGLFGKELTPKIKEFTNYLTTNKKSILDNTQKVVGAVSIAFGAIGDTLGVAIDGIDFVAQAFGGWDAITPILIGVGAVLFPVVGAISAVVFAVSDLKSAFSGGDSVIRDWFLDNFGIDIVPIMKDISSEIKNFVTENKSTLAGLVPIGSMIAGAFAVKSIGKVLGLGKTIMGLGKAFMSVRKTASWLGKAFMSVRKTASWLGKAFMFVGKTALWLGRALLMNPIGLAVTAIAGTAYLIYTNWDKIKVVFNNTVTAMKGYWDNFTTWISTKFSWVNTIIPTIKTTFFGVIDSIRGVWDSFFGWISSKFEWISSMISSISSSFSMGASSFGSGVKMVAPPAMQKLSYVKVQRPISNQSNRNNHTNHINVTVNNPSKNVDVLHAFKKATKSLNDSRY